MFQHLCRRPIHEYEACSWGIAPGNAIVVSSAMDMKERQAIQGFMTYAVKHFGQKAVSSGQPVDQLPGQSNMNNGKNILSSPPKELSPTGYP